MLTSTTSISNNVYACKQRKISPHKCTSIAFGSFYQLQNGAKSALISLKLSSSINFPSVHGRIERFSFVSYNFFFHRTVSNLCCCHAWREKKKISSSL
jgi:hypothetical protein